MTLRDEARWMVTRSIDELLQAPCWVIDPLPRQVPPDSPGQFFAIERYWLEPEHLAHIKQRHINVVLKLNCYVAISLDGEAQVNPDPAHIAEQMRTRTLFVMLDDAMILSEPDDTNLSLFNPSEELLELVEAVAASEGLYVWKSPWS